MLADLSNLTAGHNCVRDALAEIRACHSELQAFVTGMFDQLDELVTGRLDPNALRTDGPQEPDREALKDQIERLAAVAAELTQSVAEQKRLAARENRGKPR